MAGRRPAKAVTSSSAAAPLAGGPRSVRTEAARAGRANVAKAGLRLGRRPAVSLAKLIQVSGLADVGLVRRPLLGVVPATALTTASALAANDPP